MTTRSGVAILGDSTSIVSYKGTAAPSFAGWDTRLAARLGCTVENYGVDGAIAYQFTSTGNVYRTWAASSARYFLIRFGYNDSKPDAWAALTPPQVYTTDAQMAAAMTTAIHDLVLEIRALGDGAEPVLVTNYVIAYPRLHYWDRNSTIDYYNGVLTGEAANFTVPIVPLRERFQAETDRGATLLPMGHFPDSLGGGDLWMRSDTIVSDSANDAAHYADSDSTYWTNIHPNGNGCALIADETANYFERFSKRSITGTTTQATAIRTLLDGAAGYPVCDCPIHQQHAPRGAFLHFTACPCTSRTVTDPACPYLTSHASAIDDLGGGSFRHRLSLKDELNYIDARTAAIAAGGGGTALQLILAGCPNPA